MTDASPLPRILLHVTDPSRGDVDLVGVEFVPPTASPSAWAERLDDAALLVVDDALAFPFEALRDVDRDVPVAVRVPVDLDRAGVESVLGADLLDHLTPLDVVAGPGALGAALARRRLPRSRLVGGPGVPLRHLVDQGRKWRRELDEHWRPRPTPDGAPLDVVNHPIAADETSLRLHLVKRRLRQERDLLRLELAAVAADQPSTRALTVAIAARRPAAWASALPASFDDWIALPLVAGEEPSRDTIDLGARVVELPASLRLTMPPDAVDVAVLCDDVLHSPTHALERLLAELARVVRPGGSLLILAEVVPDPRRDAELRPGPLSAEAVVSSVGRAAARQMVLEDVRSYRRAGDDHTRAALFRWRQLGTGPKESSWT